MFSYWNRFRSGIIVLLVCSLLWNVALADWAGSRNFEPVRSVGAGHHDMLRARPGMVLHSDEFFKQNPTQPQPAIELSAFVPHWGSRFRFGWRYKFALTVETLLVSALAIVSLHFVPVGEGAFESILGLLSLTGIAAAFAFVHYERGVNLREFMSQKFPFVFLVGFVMAASWISPYGLLALAVIYSFHQLYRKKRMNAVAGLGVAGTLAIMIFYISQDPSLFLKLSPVYLVFLTLAHYWFNDKKARSYKVGDGSPNESVHMPAEQDSTINFVVQEDELDQESAEQDPTINFVVQTLQKIKRENDPSLRQELVSVLNGKINWDQLLEASGKPEFGFFGVDLIAFVHNSTDRGLKRKLIACLSRINLEELFDRPENSRIEEFRENLIVFIIHSSEFVGPNRLGVSYFAKNIGSLEKILNATLTSFDASKAKLLFRFLDKSENDILKKFLASFLVQHSDILIDKYGFFLAEYLNRYAMESTHGELKAKWQSYLSERDRLANVWGLYLQSRNWSGIKDLICFLEAAGNVDQKKSLDLLLRDSWQDLTGVDSSALSRFLIQYVIRNGEDERSVLREKRNEIFEIRDGAREMPKQHEHRDSYFWFRQVLRYFYPSQFIKEDEYGRAYSSEDQFSPLSTILDIKRFDKTITLAGGGFELRDAAAPVNFKCFDPLLQALAYLKGKRRVDQDKFMETQAWIRLWNASATNEDQVNFWKVLICNMGDENAQNLPLDFQSIEDFYRVQTFINDIAVARIPLPQDLDLGAFFFKPVNFGIIFRKIEQWRRGKMKREQVLNESRKYLESLGYSETVLEKLDFEIFGLQETLQSADFQQKSLQEKLGNFLAAARLTSEDVALRIYKNVVQKMQNEAEQSYQRQFKPVEKKPQTLRIYMSKRSALELVSMDICVWSDKSLWRDPNTFFIMSENLQTRVIEGGAIVRKVGPYLILSFNPSPGILADINYNALYDDILEELQTLAHKIGATVAIPIERGVHSNRPQIQEMLRKRKYPVVNLEQPVVFATAGSVSYGTKTVWVPPVKSATALGQGAQTVGARGRVSQYEFLPSVPNTDLGETLAFLNHWLSKTLGNKSDLSEKLKKFEHYSGSIQEVRAWVSAIGAATGHAVMQSAWNQAVQDYIAAHSVANRELVKKWLAGFDGFIQELCAPGAGLDLRARLVAALAARMVESHWRINGHTYDDQSAAQIEDLRAQVSMQNLLGESASLVPAEISIVVETDDLEAQKEALKYALSVSKNLGQENVRYRFHVKGAGNVEKMKAWLADLNLNAECVEFKSARDLNPAQTYLVLSATPQAWEGFSNITLIDLAQITQWLSESGTSWNAVVRLEGELNRILVYLVQQ